MASLQQTNPGATAWTLLFDLIELDERINYPGQVIQRVKDHLFQHDLEPRSWKTASRMS